MTWFDATLDDRKVRFYVGGTFARYREVRAVVDALVAAGHRCTHDWTRTDEFDADGNSTGDGYDLDPRTAEKNARADLLGVLEAEVCLFLGEQLSCGWMTEFGFALATGRTRCWVVAPCRPSVFWALPQVRVFEDLAEPLRLLGAELPREAVT